MGEIVQTIYILAIAGKSYCLSSSPIETWSRVKLLRNICRVQNSTICTCPLRVISGASVTYCGYWKPSYLSLTFISFLCLSLPKFVPCSQSSFISKLPRIFTFHPSGTSVNKNQLFFYWYWSLSQYSFDASSYMMTFYLPEARMGETERMKGTEKIRLRAPWAGKMGQTML